MTEQEEKEILRSLQRRRSNEKPDDLIEKTIKIKKKHWSAIRQLIGRLNSK